MNKKSWWKFGLAGMGLIAVTQAHGDNQCPTIFKEVETGWSRTSSQDPNEVIIWYQSFTKGEAGGWYGESWPDEVKKRLYGKDWTQWSSADFQMLLDFHNTIPSKCSTCIQSSAERQNFDTVGETIKCYRDQAGRSGSTTKQASSNTRNNRSQTPNNAASSGSNANSAAQSSDPIVNDPAFASLKPKQQQQLLAARQKNGERTYRNMSDCVEAKPSHAGTGFWRVYNHCNVPVEYTFCWTNDTVPEYPNLGGCEENQYGSGFTVKPGKWDGFAPPRSKDRDHRIYISACESPGYSANKQWLGEPKGFSFKCK